MASMRMNGVIGACIATGLLVTSTGAAAAAESIPAPQQVSPWAALAVLSSGAPAATLCGSAGVTATATAAAAAQTPAGGCVLPAVDAPPPVAAAEPAPGVPVAPPVTPVSYAVSPLFPALMALALGAAAYFLVRNDHHTISPA